MVDQLYIGDAGNQKFFSLVNICHLEQINNNLSYLGLCDCPVIVSIKRPEDPVQFILSGLNLYAGSQQIILKVQKSSVFLFRISS